LSTQHVPDDFASRFTDQVVQDVVFVTVFPVTPDVLPDHQSMPDLRSLAEFFQVIARVLEQRDMTPFTGPLMLEGFLDMIGFF
jgi:hypothetical protein